MLNPALDLLGAGAFQIPLESNPLKEDSKMVVSATPISPMATDKPIGKIQTAQIPFLGGGQTQNDQGADLHPRRNHAAAHPPQKRRQESPSAPNLTVGPTPAAWQDQAISNCANPARVPQASTSPAAQSNCATPTSNPTNTIFSKVGAKAQAQIAPGCPTWPRSGPAKS